MVKSNFILLLNFPIRAAQPLRLILRTRLELILSNAPEPWNKASSLVNVITNVK